MKAKDPQQPQRKRDRTRARILASAATLLRQRGLEGASVADVMSAAGLTVGGFYAHFPSKAALLAAALREASVGAHARLMAGVKLPPGRARLAAAVRRYLAAGHRDAPETGCPLPAVISELTRGGPLAGPALADSIDGWVRLNAGPRAADRGLALRALATCVGGLALARALGPGALSDELLRAARGVVPPSSAP